MHHNVGHTLARVRRLISERLEPAEIVERREVELSRRDLPGEPVGFAEAIDGDFRPMEIGETWGPAWSTSWFRVRAAVPEHWRGRRVELAVDLGFEPGAGPGFQAEGLAFAADGAYLKGIEPRNQYVVVAREGDAVADVDLYIEAAANPNVLANAFRPTDLGDRDTAPQHDLYRMARCELVVRDPEVAALAIDLDVVAGLAEQLAETDPQTSRLSLLLTRACDAIALADVRGTAGAARELLRPALAGPAAPSTHRVSAIGHAHIDSAWLWPTRETSRKVSRTFANVVELMRDYPELLFVASSAQQYAWLRRDHPALFEKVAERVAESRFLPVGGMWVESDTNLPGGEGLVRQFTQGVRFFREAFGVDSDVLWLPDSFGYSAALPQIARLAGMRTFVTQKLSWQPINPFPHHTFHWEGIDGSRLLAHLPPVDSYLSDLSPADLAHASRNHRDHGVASSSIVPFGHGDGGGGPTALMLERARRQADLEGSPAVSIEPPSAFFDRLREESSRLPVWVGELYMEGHRGTYTSQAAMKRGNRRGEHLLCEAERWCAAAAILAGAAYPYDKLDELWQWVLLNQFHDILPGSSIAWVHTQARGEYAEITERAEQLIGQAREALSGASSSLTADAAPTPSPVRLETGAAGTVIDNGLLRVEVTPAGEISAVHDLRRDRQIVPDGEELGRLVVHTDLPRGFDAWDLDDHYRGSRRAIGAAEQVSIDETEGSVVVTTRYTIGESTIERTLTLAPGSAGIEVELDVDWRERETILKAEMPLALKAESARYEVQFGWLDRPITTNTTWEAAKFEVCAQRWVRVAEGDYGVAIANDSTHGHDVTRELFPGTERPGVMARLSLLRSPSFPDPHADAGHHRMRYLVLPGATDLEATDAGACLNETSTAGHAPELVRVNGSARLSAVKLADDRSGDLVVRLYEAAGRRERAQLSWGVPVRHVQRVDLHEDALGDVEPVGGGVCDVALSPFQIVTLRARLR